MPVHEYRVRIPLKDVVSIEDILVEREDSRWMVVEQPIVGSAWLTGLFENRDEAAVAWMALAPLVVSYLEGMEPIVTEMADEDWKESYKAHFKAWHCGRVHWVPVWERETYELPEGDVAVWLDPGMAFGTGNHETTRLCLVRLTEIASNLAAAGEDPSSIGVIDAGCGSGILAISAAVLGCEPILGFDLDPEAIRVSRENAAINGCVDRIVLERADLKAGLHGTKARVVLANIQADILMEGRDHLLGALDSDGRLVMSGILNCELDEVKTYFLSSASAKNSESRSMGEWSDLIITRSS
jgi:ribosomal protein L11 methyltransferase